jgi:outer membrane protein
MEIVEAPSLSYTTKTIAFGNQIKDNFGQSFGATMSVPIYGKLQTHTQISQAKLSILRNEISLNKTIQNLKNDVTSAYINYTNSLAKYLALDETHKAQKKNLEFVQIRFQNGQASQFEIQSAQNTEINAYMNLISSNYEYIFRQLVLDFLINNQITNLSSK